MRTKSGIVLGPLEIANEYGTIHIYKSNLPKGEPIWIYYDGQGSIKGIEAKSSVIRNMLPSAKNGNRS